MMRSEACTSGRRLTGAKRLIHDKEDDEHISEVTRLIKRVTLSAHAARLFEIRVLAGCPGGANDALFHGGGLKIYKYCTFSLYLCRGHP